MTYTLPSGVLAEDYTDSRTRVWGRCRTTKKVYECWVPTRALELWQRGEKIQLAMPEVSAGDREFLISGISPDGWRQLFGEPSE